MKTHIINKTKQSFELKEGNAGAYRFLKQLAAGAKVSIKVDPNATYREYMVATGKKGETIFLTSDDFSEYKVIDIQEGPGDGPGAVIYKSVPSNPRKPGSRASEPPSNAGGAGGPNAGVGSVSAVSPAAGGGSDPPVSPASAAAAVGSDPRASSPAAVGLDPPASSPAGAGSVPAVSSSAGVGSVPTASSSAGAGSDPTASSVAGSKPAFAISNQNERVPWYKKLKSRFKST